MALAHAAVALNHITAAAHNHHVNAQTPIANAVTATSIRISFKTGPIFSQFSSVQSRHPLNHLLSL
jgi:hypothetical protein